MNTLTIKVIKEQANDSTFRLGVMPKVDYCEKILNAKITKIDNINQTVTLDCSNLTQEIYEQVKSKFEPLFHMEKMVGFKIIKDVQFVTIIEA